MQKHSKTIEPYFEEFYHKKTSESNNYKTQKHRKYILNKLSFLKDISIDNGLSLKVIIDCFKSKQTKLSNNQDVIARINNTFIEFLHFLKECNIFDKNEFTFLNRFGRKNVNHKQFDLLLNTTYEQYANELPVLHRKNNEIRMLLKEMGYNYKLYFKFKNIICLSLDEFLVLDIKNKKLSNKELLIYFKILYFLHKKSLAEIPYKRFIEINEHFFDLSLKKHELGCNFNLIELVKYPNFDYSPIVNRGNLNWTLKIINYSSPLLAKLMSDFLQKNKNCYLSSTFLNHFEKSMNKEITTVNELTEDLMFKMIHYYKNEVNVKISYKTIHNFFLEYSPIANSFKSFNIINARKIKNLDSYQLILLSDPFKIIPDEIDKFLISDDSFDGNSSTKYAQQMILDFSNVNPTYKSKIKEFFLNHYYLKYSSTTISEDLNNVKEYFNNYDICDLNDYLSRCNLTEYRGITRFIKYYDPSIEVISKSNPRRDIRKIQNTNESLLIELSKIANSTSSKDKIIFLTYLIVYKTNLRISSLLNLEIDDILDNGKILCRTKNNRFKQEYYISETAYLCLKKIVEITNEYRNLAAKNISKYLYLKELKYSSFSKITKFLEKDFRFNGLTTTEMRKISSGNLELSKMALGLENTTNLAIDLSHNDNSLIYNKHYVQENERIEFVFRNGIGDVDSNGNLILNSNEHLENIEQIQPCFICSYFKANNKNILKDKIERYKEYLNIATDELAIKYLKISIKKMEEKNEL